MVPEILAIEQSAVNFKQFLVIAKNLLGRSITASLDAHKMEVGSLASFIQVLDEMSAESSNPATSLREAGDLLKHLHFTFLATVDLDTYVELLETSGLNFTSVETSRRGVMMAIVSGNLLEWRTAVINTLTHNRAGYNVQAFMNKVITWFEVAGLGGLWSNFTKTSGLGGLFLLTHNK